MRRLAFPFISTVSFCLLAPIAIIASVLTGSGDFAHRIGRIWAAIVLKAAGARLTVEGKENIPRDLPVVFACNHASQLDIPVLYRAIPIQFRFLVKKELFRIPLLGLAMRKTGYIPVDRSGGREALKSLQEAASRISSGTSVAVFPEGTRSSHGRLGPFKPGAMVVAIKAGCPVVPVAIIGSWKALPKGGIFAMPGPIHVRVAHPVPTMDSNGRKRSKEELTREVWGILDSMMKEIR